MLWSNQEDKEGIDPYNLMDPFARMPPVSMLFMSRTCIGDGYISFEVGIKKWKMICLVCPIPYAIGYGDLCRSSYSIRPLGASLNEPVADYNGSHWFNLYHILGWSLSFYIGTWWLLKSVWHSPGRSIFFIPDRYNGKVPYHFRCNIRTLTADPLPDFKFCAFL